MSGRAIFRGVGRAQGGAVVVVGGGNGGGERGRGRVIPDYLQTFPGGVRPLSFLSIARQETRAKQPAGKKRDWMVVYGL